MKLVVFPGLSDPKIAYKKVYDIIKKESQRREYKAFILKSYPGHFSYDSNSYMKVNKVIKVIKSSVTELEEKADAYTILCRSFGCIPFIEFLKSFNGETKYLKKVILWGVSPYYMWYQLIRDRVKWENKFLEMKVRVKSDFFYEIYPFEFSLSELKKNFLFKIYITSGEYDEYYPEFFRNTLLNINKNPSVVFPKRVKGVDHAVTNPNDDYFNLIFGD